MLFYLIAVMLLIVLWRRQSVEKFATRSDKAEAIVKWWGAAADPAFVDFRNDTGADIVSYEDARRLYRDGKLTTAAMLATM